MEGGILVVSVAFLGLIAGSFLNAVLFRYNTGRSALAGRSGCMQCGHTLTALDLVPVLSYLWLKGKCRHCHCKVSIQYPLVELAGMVLAVGIFLQHPTIVGFILAFCTWIVLIFLVVYDIRHFILPWGSLIVLSLLALLQIGLAGITPLALLAGPLLAAPFLLLSLVSGGRWMGWGDTPLALGIGWLLGLTGAMTAFILSFWIGAPIAILLLVYSKIRTSSKGTHKGGYTMKSEVPFAPFLVAGAACVYFFHVDLFTKVSTLFF